MIEKTLSQVLAENNLTPLNIFDFWVEYQAAFKEFNNCNPLESVEYLRNNPMRDKRQDIIFNIFTWIGLRTVDTIYTEIQKEKIG